MEILGLEILGVTLKTILIALAGGVLPTLIWLWFWLQENRNDPEPIGLIILTFIMGMIAVVLVLPIQELISILPINESQMLILWASSEEIIKYAIVAISILGLSSVNKPVDYAIYMITGALGFAALENTLFLIDPIHLQDTTIGLLTGNLRFLGSTVLHATASGIIGIGLGLSYKKSKLRRFIYFTISIVTASVIHTIFNFFLTKKDTGLLIPFGFIWIITLVLILAFEQVRSMSIEQTVEKQNYEL